MLFRKKKQGFVSEHVNIKPIWWLSLDSFEILIRYMKCLRGKCFWYGFSFHFNESENLNKNLVITISSETAPHTHFFAKKVFLKILRNLQGNNCSGEFWEFCRLKKLQIFWKRTCGRLFFFNKVACWRHNINIKSLIHLHVLILLPLTKSNLFAPFT